ncbi:MAG: peptide chain release factor N(5)-glutamine methyltransferase [Nitrospinota bacterium]
MARSAGGVSPLNPLIEKEGKIKNAGFRLNLLEDGIVALSGTTTDTPELDAQILMSHALGITRISLLANPPEKLTSTDEKLFWELITRRAAGEPVAYLTGHKDFYKHAFLVNRSTLIPRPETEILVEETLRRFTAAKAIRLLDIGTGCGCIALSLAAERPDWEITATDISGNALAVAKENGKELGIKNVEFSHSNLFDNVQGKFDAIVSNPPYVDIKEKQNLQIELRDYEPESALFTTDGGLKVIGKLIRETPAFLNGGGTFFCEIGYGQRDLVEALFDKNIWTQIVFHRDLAGHMRVVSAVFKSVVNG